MSEIMIAKINVSGPCHDLGEMIKDIKINGLKEPIVVRKSSNFRYDLVDGSRRLHAYQFLGCTHISAEIIDD